MFWGWYNLGNGPRSSGCFFLPFLCLCGSPFLFTGFNSRFLWPFILIAILGLVIPGLLNQGTRQQAYNEDWDGELPDGDKPKRSGEYLYGDDGELIEGVQPLKGPIQPDYDDV